MRHFYITEEGIRLKAIRKDGCKGCYYLELGPGGGDECRDINRGGVEAKCISDDDPRETYIWVKAPTLKKRPTKTWPMKTTSYWGGEAPSPDGPHKGMLPDFRGGWSYPRKSSH